MKFAKVIPVLLALSLVACGKGHDSNDAPKLFEEQRAMIDKAKNVENTLQQQSDEQKNAIDQQSQ